MLSYYQDHPYSVLSGDRQPNGDKEEKWKCFDSVVSKFLYEQRIPGASVAISRKSEIIYKQGYGIAGCSRRVQPDSVFRIASISKSITAAVVLHVCQEKNMSLDMPVFGKQGILKTYRTQDKRMKKISIRHLLQHSAGWDRDKVGDAAFVRPQCVVQHHPDTQEYNHALLSYALRRKLQFSPGTWHAYSNLGYLALGLVVEEITGKPYDEVLKDFLQTLGICGISVGQRRRSDWGGLEVEYFNNKDPELVESLYPNESLVLPQYGGMAMPSSASYGGLIADTGSLLQFLYCMETAVPASAQTEESSPKTITCELFDDKDRASSSDHTEECIDPELQKVLGEDTSTGSLKRHGDLKSVPLMSSSQAVETLRRPTFENSTAGDWYGLGWDVQDNGTSWGHTGGMEGTCGTLYHHGQSGLSWAFLLNAWAQDCDLNGVIKSGLMLTDLASDGDASAVFPGFEKLAWNTESCRSRSGAVKVVTPNKQQIVLLNTTEAESIRAVSDFKPQGYSVTWLSCITQQLGLEAEVVTSECSDTQNCSHSCDPPLANTNLCHKYCLIFTKTDFVFKDYFVLFNMQLNEFKTAWCKYKEAGCYISFLDSFCWNSSLRSNAVICVDNNSDESLGTSTDFSTLPASLHSKKSSMSTSLQQMSYSTPLNTTTSLMQESSAREEKTEVVLAMKATEYVRFVQSVVVSHLVLVQTVTEVDRELWVSAVLQTRPHSHRHHRLNQAEKGDLEHRKANKRKSFQRQNKLVKRSSVCGDSGPYKKITRSRKSITLLIPDQSLSPNKLNDFQEEHNLLLGISASPTASTTKHSRLKTSVDAKDIVYWVQITPESFLTELHRQIQRGRSLQYTKFYTVSGKPYVSAVWAMSSMEFSEASTIASERSPQLCSTCTAQNASDTAPDLSTTSRYHRTAMSKYGLLPELSEAASKNLCLQSLSEYREEDGSVYYAAVWFA